MSWRLGRWTAVAFFAAITVLPMSLLARPLSGFGHTQWSRREGAPTGIRGVAQTRDGWIWLPSSRGLFRFDGVTFEQVSSPPHVPSGTQAVTAIYADSDGALWVGYASGITLRIPEGATGGGVRFDGLSNGEGALGFFRTSTGQMWAITRKGLYRLAGNVWSEVMPLDERTDAASAQVVEDGERTLWIATGRGLLGYDPSARRVRHPAHWSGSADAVGLTEDGRIWAHGPSGFGFPEGRQMPPSASGNGGGAANGAVAWRGGAETWTHAGTALCLKFGTLPEACTAELSSPGIQGIMGDTRGNIWIATNFGLDRFRWAGVEAARRDVRWDFVGSREPSSAGRVLCLLAACVLRAKDVLGTDRGIPLDDNASLWLGVSGFAPSPLGSLWTGRVRLGVPRSRVTAFARDGENGVWLGTWDSELVRIEPGVLSQTSSNQGLSAGPIRVIVPGSHALIGGEDGMFVIDEGRVRGVKSTRPDALTGVTGLLQLGDGTVWLNGNAGAVRISADELGQSLANPSYSAVVRVIGIAEGMLGTARQDGFFPTLELTRNGKLWFDTTSGPVTVDPWAFPSVEYAPRPEIVSVAFGGQIHSPGGTFHIPAGVRAIRFVYTALGAALAEDIVFRYRLDGFDGQWQEAGTRRATTYTNLPPGRYRFVVTATNGDGKWHVAGQAQDIVIEAFFYQTSEAHGLAIALFVFVAYAFVVMRSRQMARRIEHGLRERQDERDRLAREIHDTFLQSVQGLILHVHAATLDLPMGRSRERMERALDLGEQTLEEGRLQLFRIRDARRVGTELLNELLLVTTDHAIANPPSVYPRVAGIARRLRPLVQDELYSVAREAIRNVLRHAAASQLDICLTYTWRTMTVEIVDNGVGIAPDILAAGGRSGHWGLTGMHERMARLGGILGVSSVPGAGTRVTMRLTARQAYRSRSP